MTKAEEEDLNNFYLHRKWLSLLTGHADTTSFAYRLYILVVYLMYGYLLGAALATMLFIPLDKELLVKTTHVILLIIWAACILACRLVMDRSVKVAKDLVKSGLYKYEGEPPDEAVDEMKREGIRASKNRSNYLARMFICSGMANIVVYPLTQLLVGVDPSESALNPYLNLPLYMPFDTMTLHGYSAAVLLNLLYNILVYGLATSMNEIFISYTGTLSTQSAILNHSLRNLRKRACLTYKERTGIRVDQHNYQVIVQEPVFQECLNHCLKSNVKHHLALTEFKNICQGYLGSTLLTLLVVVAVVLATTLSLLLEKLPPNKFVTYLLTGVAECIYPFTLCYFGEGVLTESSKTFGSVYDTPWMESNPSFKRVALIMMANTRTPMKIRASIFDIPASLSTFGDIVANMYKIINVIRQK